MTSLTRRQVWWLLVVVASAASVLLFAVIDYSAPRDLVMMRELGAFGLGITFDLGVALLGLLVLRTDRIKGAFGVLLVAVLFDVLLFLAIGFAQGHV